MKLELASLILAGLNILQVFGVSEDCTNIKKFLIKHRYNFNTEDCCDLINDGDYEYEILCDKSENINSMTFRFSKSNTIDFSSFPLFSKLEELDIDGEVFPNKILSARFFDLPNLKKLIVRQTYKMPDKINAASPVEEITLNDNGITQFPYVFKNLKKLKSLSLQNNQITGPLKTEIKDFPALENLDISQNKFEGELIIPNTLKSIDISDNQFTTYSNSNDNKVLEEFVSNHNDLSDAFMEDLADVQSLKKIKISNSKLEKLPNTIFNLTKIEEFDISNNPKLNVKIVNFGINNDTKPLSHCNFMSTNILCYQNNTCGDKDYSGYKQCTLKEINSIKYGMDEASSAFASYNLNKLYLIVSVLSIILLF